MAATLSGSPVHSPAYDQKVKSLLVLPGSYCYAHITLQRGIFGLKGLPFFPTGDPGPSMARNPGRPLSPHLTIWKWGPHMLVSILHRATGTALALGGGVLLAWWLTALAGGAVSYARFVDLMTSDASGRLNVIPAFILVGLTWSFLQH